MRALGGRIELGGLAGAGMVDIEGRQSDGVFRLTSLRFQDAVERGDVLLTNFAFVDVAAAGGGSIAVNARNLEVLGGVFGASRLQAGIASGLGSPEATAGDITLNATGAITVGQSSRIENSVNSNATGNGGNLTIDTGSLSIRDGAIVGARTYGAGDAGNVTIRASERLEARGGAQVSVSTFSAGDAGDLTVVDTDLVEVVGTDAEGDTSGLFAQVNEGATGTGGNLTINTGRLSVRDGAIVSADTSGEGNAGNLLVRSRDLVEVVGTSASGSSSFLSADVNQGAKGTGGNLTIETGSLSVSNGAQVSASTSGVGNAGDLTVRARDSVELSQGGSLKAQVNPEAQGNGGDLTIETGRLSALYGSFVAASTFGAGNAGTLSVRASDIKLSGTAAGGTSTPSGLFTEVGRQGATGAGGNLNVEVGRLSLSDGARIRVDTFGAGNAGTLNVRAADAVELSGNSGISAQVNGEATGTGGNLTVETGRLSVRDGADVVVDTSGEGNAGSLQVRSRDSVEVVGADSFLSADVLEGAKGNGGNLTIETGRLSIRDGAAISVNTSGQGRGGNLTVNASKSVELIGSSADGQSFSRLASETFGAGDAGNVTIATGQLLVQGGAFVSAGTRPGSQGQGRTLAVTASDSVELSGGGGLFAQTEGGGDGGDLTIETRRLSVSDGGRLSTDTFSAGKAGNLTINVENLSVKNSQVSASTFNLGDAGNLTVNASESIELSGESLERNGKPIGPGGLLAQADLQGKGKGGNLTVETKRLSISNGGKIQAATFDDGNAGEINIRASEIEVFNTSDANITFATEISAGSLRDAQGRNINSPLKGNGGSINIEADRLNIRNGARINVSSDGQGKSGNINIQTGSLNLSDRAQISAATASGEGGNINLNIDDTLVMRNNSRISAEALNDANGGNITINAPDGFVVAFPNQNNDIAANAAQGKGGNINITASSIFGIEERPLNPVTNDINASSEFGLQGNISINNPDVDPEQGLIELPAELADASNQITSGSCPAGGENKFTITGRGGLPPNPREPLSGEAVLTNWATLEGAGSREQGAGKRGTTSTNSASSGQSQIVEATGWVVNDKGEVVLTAAAPTDNLDIPWLPESGCHASKPSF